MPLRWLLILWNEYDILPNGQNGNEWYRTEIIVHFHLICDDSPYPQRYWAVRKVWRLITYTQSWIRQMILTFRLRSDFVIVNVAKSHEGKAIIEFTQPYDMIRINNEICDIYESMYIVKVYYCLNGVYMTYNCQKRCSVWCELYGIRFK